MENNSNVNKFMIEGEKDSGAGVVFIKTFFLLSYLQSSQIS
jgi:hypothetical protein